MDQGGLGERLWRDCWACALSMGDAMEHGGWRRRLVAAMGVSGWMFLLVPAHPGCPKQSPESCKRLCVCVYVCACARACTFSSGWVIMVLSWQWSSSVLNPDNWDRCPFVGMLSCCVTCQSVQLPLMEREVWVLAKENWKCYAAGKLTRLWYIHLHAQWPEQGIWAPHMHNLARMHDTVVN